jgi:hypothetical protein
LKVALNTITITFSLPFSVTVHLPGELISIIAIDSLSLSDNSQLVRLDMVISSSLEFYKYTVFYLGMWSAIYVYYYESIIILPFLSRTYWNTFDCFKSFSKCIKYDRVIVV